MKKIFILAGFVIILMIGVGVFATTDIGKDQNVNIRVTTTNNVTKQKETLTRLVQAAMEEAYFEGQRDAIEGDIRIEYNGWDETYAWTKSPWDNGKETIFKPENIKKK